jgi:SAM-dependent methyltransferase
MTSNIFPRLEFVAQALVRRERQCPYCSSAEFQRVATKYGVIQIAECSRCGLYFTNPVYRSVIGSRLYNSMYSAEGLTTKTPKGSQLQTLKREAFAGTDKDASRQLAYLTQLTAGRRLLEIGSSWGYFLFQAMQQGWKAVGIEVADRRRFAGIRGLGVDIQPSFDAVHTSAAVFDVVYSSHTLEHFTTLASVFRDIRGALADDGYLAIEVPECDIRRDGDSVLSRIGAVHPVGFSSAFFSRVLPREGFRVCGVYSGWPVDGAEPLQRTGQLVVIAQKYSG